MEYGGCGALLTLTLPDGLPIVGVPVLPGYWQVLRIATLLTFAGHIIVGRVERLKVKLRDPVREFPAISDAWIPIATEPSGKLAILNVCCHTPPLTVPDC